MIFPIYVYRSRATFATLISLFISEGDADYSDDMLIAQMMITRRCMCVCACVVREGKCCTMLSISRDNRRGISAEFCAPACACDRIEGEK